MNKVIIDKIPETIMKSVDFEENSIYLTICGKVRYNVYNGEKKSATDAATSEAQMESDMIDNHASIIPQKMEVVKG